MGRVACNRPKLLLEIVRGIRGACGPDFQLGVRISPERFGLRLSEMLEVATMLYASDIDYLDLSIWDVTKEAEEEQYRGQTLASHFIALDRNSIRLGLAGKLIGLGARHSNAWPWEPTTLRSARRGLLYTTYLNRWRRIRTSPPRCQ